MVSFEAISQSRDTLHYPITDRRGDPFAWQNNNPFNLTDTALLKQDIEYDPETKQYYILEKNRQYPIQKTKLSYAG